VLTFNQWRTPPGSVCPLLTSDQTTLIVRQNMNGRDYSVSNQHGVSPDVSIREIPSEALAREIVEALTKLAAFRK
jgi:hypothetical protein